jgi:AraC-like DNA-binding protein/mannose-6-phosphate isomerase-like protein (cupin superfamily)
MMEDKYQGNKTIVVPDKIKQLLSVHEITKQLYITRISYYPKGQYKKNGNADENIFVYCETGACKIKYQEENYSLSQNQAFVIPANSSYSYEPEKSNPGSIYWLQFDGSDTGWFSSVIGRVVNLPDFIRSNFFEDLYRTLEMGYSLKNLEYIRFCCLYLLASINYQLPDWMQKSIAYMKENLEKKIVLEDIANYVNYSTSRLIALFKENTSYSPMEYYNQLKIQKACSYLQFSDLEIKEIAFRLGFHDQFHFSNSFKKEMGMSPKKFREQNEFLPE